jgi:hypothetical protein
VKTGHFGTFGTIVDWVDSWFDDETPMMTYREFKKLADFKNTQGKRNLKNLPRKN